MTVLDRKLRRDLLGYKWLLSTVVLIISIGIAGFVSNLSFYFNLELSRQAFYSECRMADFWLDFERLPEAELDRLRNIPGISELQTRIAFPVSIDLPGEPRLVTGQILSMPNTRIPRICDIVITSGG